MLQNDASQADLTLDARNDVDAVTQCPTGSESGNVISGVGTLSGAAGADVSGAGATVVAVNGTESSGGTISVEGSYGTLVMQSDGSYMYTRSASAPDGVSDVFTYAIADSSGTRASATLTIQLRCEDEAEEQTMLTTPDGVVMLPAGVELSDIRVVGRDLVITLPDGSTMTIPNGAVFVPQLVIGDVEVPPSNLAALLIDAEPQPAAGETPQSSGGNFEVDVPPLDPGVDLGDLIPPTEMDYTPPTFEEAGQVVDRDPEIFIQPDGQPASIDAIDSVDERGLPTRNGGEPAGSGESADGNGGNNSDTSETTTGVILVNSPDGIASLTITGANGVAQPIVAGLVVQGTYGTLTIVSVVNGTVSYSYTLSDNTSGDLTNDNFSVSVTDPDGDVATATLRIDIVNDLPTAVDDTDSIAAGQFGPATGNVITDAAAGDAGDSDTGADTVGADNASVTSVSGAGGSDSTFAFDAVFGDNVLVVNGQYGVLTIAANGNYSYVRNEGTPGGVQDVFTYTLTDGDTNADTATLTISIGDATPQTGENPDVLLDDDALPGGNPGGPGDDVDSANASGTLAGSGGDGALTFDLLTTGAPSGFTYVDGTNGSVLVQQGGVTVLTITINAATGAYTVTQNAPIDHSVPGTEDNVSFTINYTVTDVDGDPAPGSFVINVDDDTPVIDRVDIDAPTLIVDETNLAQNASGNFSSLFSVSYGADGAGTTEYSLSVVNGTDSGLIDVATGDPILLFDNNGVIEGRVGGEGGAVAFTVSVNSGTGEVTLDQVRALDHPDAGNPDDPVSPNADSIQLNVTATDADGDPVSDSVNIGDNLVFEDDGPSVTGVTATDGVLLDETEAGSPAGFPISASSAGAVISATSAYGADGAGSTVYGLQLQGGVMSLPSGLQTAIGDLPITLVLVSSTVIEGQYQDGGTQVAFTIEMNADGSITVTQDVPLEHLVDGPPGPAHDDPLDLGNLVEATVTVTDRDGDQASGSAAIGDNIVFEDDGPSIDVQAGDDSGVILRTDDPQTIGGASDTASSTANFSGVFSALFDGGADGAAGDPVFTNFALGVSSQGVDSGLNQGGNSIYLYLIGGVVVGSTSATEAGVTAGNTVFDVSVNGSGVVTLTQYSQIDHPISDDPSATETPFGDDIISMVDELVTLSATGTVTDNDGDTATDTATIDIGANLEFSDDGPDISAVLTGNEIRIDETDGVTAPGEVDPVGGNLGTVTVSAATLFTVTNVHTSADSPTTYSYALALSSQGVDSGLQVSSNDATIYLYEMADGSVVGSTSATFAGINAGNTAFTVSIDGSGDVTVTQFLAIEHGDTNSNDEDSPSFDPNVLQIEITATDFDGDTDVATVDLGSVIVFEDDGPSATQNQSTGTVDEDGVPGGIADGPGDVAGENTQATGSVTGLFNSGSDAPLTYSLSTDTSGLPVLTSNGFPVTYAVVGNTLTATANGSTIFTFELTAGGNWTFTLEDQIDHPTLNGMVGDDTENDLDIALGSIVQATDADGDTVTANPNGVVITVDDDTPVARNDTDAITGGGNTATGNVITGAGTTSGVAGADSTGADAPATVTAISGTGGTDDIFNAGVLTITGDHGFIEIDENGEYTYTRTDMTPGNYDDQFTYTYTDADGDSVTATLTISITDNAPVLVAPGPVQLDDDNALGVVGNPGGPNDDAVSGTNGTLSASGGDGDIDYFFSASQTPPAGFTYNQVNATTLQILQGATVIATVTLNNETGDYSVVQNNPVQHETLDGLAGDNTENNTPNFNVSFFAQDSDGDNSNAVNLIINIDDDTPENNGTVLPPFQVHEDALNNADAVGNSEGGQTTTAVISAAAIASLVSPGADTPITIGLNAAIDGTATGLTQNGVIIVWDYVSPTQVNGVVAGSDDVVFTLVRTGDNYTFTLLDNIDHDFDGNLFTGQGDAFNENLSLAGVFTATDSDGDTIVIDAGASVNIQNDVPIASTTQLTGTVDEDGVVENAAPGVQRGDGIAGGTGDVAGESVTATGNVSALFSAGADSPLFYSLVSSFAALTAQGLTSGGTALSYSVDFDPVLAVYTLTATAGPGGYTVFTFELDSNTGAYEFTLVDQLDHPTLNGVAGDNTENDLTINLSSIIRGTDSDGDTASAGANGLIITVDDDSPKINAVDTTLNIDNDATPSGTGVFDFDIGADENFDFDDITLSNFSVTVNGAAATNVVLTPGAETASTANYTFSFDYDTGTGGTATATGTLVFDKDAGTYTATLTNGPIQGFSILDTGSADASAFTSYQSADNPTGSPEIAVAALADNFFVQFTGDAEPGSGTGSDNLFTTQGDSGSFTPVTTANFANLELVTQAEASVTISSTAAGVAGNTIQGGEVLDFNLYSTDPGATTGGIPTADSTSMFIKLDGVGTSEDMIVILKLYDTVTGQYTTKAVIVENGDIIKTDATLTGTVYDGITLDNNDGLIVIEANDYQEGNTNLVIVGAQILGSDEGITGTGINLNGAIDGASSGTQAFSTDTSDAPFKITSIGFLTDSSEDQNAQLNFDVTIEDFDGDSLTQPITINFGDPPAMMATAMEPLATKSTALVSESLSAQTLANDNFDEQLRTSTASNNNAVFLGAVAAAGLVGSPAAAHASLVDTMDIPLHGITSLQPSSLAIGGQVEAVSGDSLIAVKSTALVQDGSHVPTSSSGSEQSDQSLSVSQSEPESQSAPPELPGGTDVPASAQASDIAAAATSVGMPDAAVVAAESAPGIDAAHGGGSGLAQVLADALAGGTNGPNIDAVLDAVAAQNSGGDPVAQLGGGMEHGVPAWDSAGFAGLHGMQSAFTMDQVMIHPDAAPAA